MTRIVHSIFVNPNRFVLFFSLLFVLIHSVLLTFEFPYFSLFSFAFFLFVLSIWSLEYAFRIAVFFTPISISLNELAPSFPLDLHLPTEPIFAFISLIFVLQAMRQPKQYVWQLRHPVSISISIYLVWMAFTVITSSMPFVSFKFLLSRLWYIIPIYFFGLHLFRNPKNIRLIIWLYVFPLLIVILYTLLRHASFGFHNQEAAHFVMSPFFKDHTSYGAALAFMFFPLSAMLFQRNYSVILRISFVPLLLLLSVGIIYSYTRATWGSLVVAILFIPILYYRIKIRNLLLLLLIILLPLSRYAYDMYDDMKRNEQDSSADLSEHVRSMSNISSDASNLERINRWKSAFAMIEEQPIIGFGAGTYMFQYAPYQQAADRTIISTNFGEVGNAHSEYISAFVETGFFGLLSFIAIIFFTIRTGLRLYHGETDKSTKILIASLLLALITYYTHSLLNNYLDTDKISLPFWGFTAMLVALDARKRSKADA